MHRSHRARSFADRGRDALHRTLPHVADREHAGQRRLERQGRARRVLGAGRDRVGQRAVGEDEAVAVERDAVAEPAGRGLGADEAEQPGARRPCARSPLGVCSSVTCAEVAVAGERAHLGVGAHVDAVVGFDALDQVVRHRVDRASRAGSRATRGTSAAPCRSRPGPAELPPPTTITSKPPQMRASMSVAA